MMRDAVPIEVTPSEARDRLTAASADERPALLDCRSPAEHRIARIDGSILVPLPEFERRIHELADLRPRPIIVYCHGGVRSLTAAHLLRRHGFERVQSLAGGIDRWSREIDPAVPRY